ncbi:hypothetical protein J4220_00490 [Candidatus Micrarchaeota archaeon]|nr:hypothetical protein [Candidatus Micrarchaeota archaeon]
MDNNKLAIVLFTITVAALMLGSLLILFKTGFRPTGLVSNPTGTVSAEVSGGTDIFLQSFLVNFGAVQVGVTYNGAGDGNWSNASAFLLRNDGSVNVNVTIAATALWSSTAGAAANYTYNVTNATGNTSMPETCATVQNGWNIMPLGSASAALCMLGFTDGNDYANISIRITVPTGEGAGEKTSTVTFTGSQG